VSYHHSLARVLTVVAAASLLAACQGGGATAPAPGQPAVLGAQSSASSPLTAARAVAGAHHDSDHNEKTPELAANPSSLHFTDAQATAGTPQSVTVSAKSSDKLSVSIAGTGNCPTVSPAKLKKSGVITVTPSGAGPAACVITVSEGDSDHHADGDRDNDRHGDTDHHGDNDRHGDNDHHGDADDTLMIPVTVDAAPVATPTPSPTPVPCGARGC
jgi:hypothetical protein